MDPKGEPGFHGISGIPGLPGIQGIKGKPGVCTEAEIRYIETKIGIWILLLVLNRMMVYLSF